MAHGTNVMQICIPLLLNTENGTLEVREIKYGKYKQKYVDTEKSWLQNSDFLGIEKYRNTEKYFTTLVPVMVVIIRVLANS